MFFFSYYNVSSVSVGVGILLRQGAKKHYEILAVLVLKTKGAGELQVPGEVTMSILTLVTVPGGTGVEPLNVSRTFVAETEAKAGAKEEFGCSLLDFPLSCEGTAKFSGAWWAACAGRHKKDFDTKLFGQSNSRSKMSALKTALTHVRLHFVERLNGWS